ncbi:acyl-CoA thioesterase [Pontixanthobacter sp.]|uniref:acyl-CoA thioesterase n=1 Tax=Pontixanthobacter sp. TaxID=2792078 RepID=UPI003C7DC755
MSVANLTDPITAKGGDVILENAQSWMQGRTLYGGASALIAYISAIRAFPQLPPLRAGQIGFAAPVGRAFAVHSEIIRQGRSVTQLRSEITCGGKVALTALWLFGTGREANAVHTGTAHIPGAGRPEDALPADTSRAPEFLKCNYDTRYTPERSGVGEPVIRRWTRLKDKGDLDPVSELILVGDTMPPSAMRIMQRPGPISSINWSFNVLDTHPATRDGWWLAETASDHANEGYSSERLRLWNADGKPMLSGIQAVAIFG